jgi:hypothetical protein
MSDARGESLFCDKKRALCDKTIPDQPIGMGIGMERL